MKNYSAKSIVAIAFSIVLFTSCKKDVRDFDTARNNTVIYKGPTTNNAEIMQMAKPGTGGNGFWRPETTKIVVNPPKY